MSHLSHVVKWMRRPATVFILSPVLPRCLQTRLAKVRHCNVVSACAEVRWKDSYDSSSITSTRGRQKALSNPHGIPPRIHCKSSTPNCLKTSRKEREARGNPSRLIHIIAASVTVRVDTLQVFFSPWKSWHRIY